MMTERKSGVLLHITSLPGRFGIGDLGEGAEQFIQFLKKSGQTYWQVLPINPTDGISEHSPYSSSSAFAGNVLLISPEQLVYDGFLVTEDIELTGQWLDHAVDYEAVVKYKNSILDTAFRKFKQKSGTNPTVQKRFLEFCDEQAYWLDDYALFSTIKNAHGQTIWTQWPDELKRRDQEALEDFTKIHSDELLKVKFLQYLFFDQWGQLKQKCDDSGIKLIGDMAIYMNWDSADVWANKGSYKLDKEFTPQVVAGVPPDYFSRTGQRWGNPVYDWNFLKDSRYEWWLERLKFGFKLFDVVRIDHFRGLVQYWEIPYEEMTAENGTWADVPTDDFLKAVIEEFHGMPNILAEDLGYITDDVREVMKKYNIPGMKVLMFAFSDGLKIHPYLPHNYTEQCAVYTGTHDNNTAKAWYLHDISKKEKDNLNSYCKTDVNPDNVNWILSELAANSKANLVMIPYQDIIGLGPGGRMNRPGSVGHNWKWRIERLDPDGEAGRRLRQLTSKTGRCME